jgi:hypothetical protein
VILLLWGVDAMSFEINRQAVNRVFDFEVLDL